MELYSFRHIHSKIIKKRNNEEIISHTIKPTFLHIVYDVLAEQVIVAQHHGRAELRQVFLHPHHFLFQYFLTGNFLSDPGEEKHKALDCLTARRMLFNQHTLQR